MWPCLEVGARLAGWVAAAGGGGSAGEEFGRRQAEVLGELRAQYAAHLRRAVAGVAAAGRAWQKMPSTSSTRMMNPRVLSKMPSDDVTSNICQALARHVLGQSLNSRLLSYMPTMTCGSISTRPSLPARHCWAPSAPPQYTRRRAAIPTNAAARTPATTAARARTAGPGRFCPPCHQTHIIPSCIN